MPAIKRNPHLTTYDIENLLREAGFSPGVTAEGRPQPGYHVWRQYPIGREASKKGGVLRVKAVNCTPGSGGRNNLERYFVEALRDPNNRYGGLWVQVRGCKPGVIIIPQESKYLPGSHDAQAYGHKTGAKITRRKRNTPGPDGAGAVSIEQTEEANA